MRQGRWLNDYGDIPRWYWQSTAFYRMRKRCRATWIILAAAFALGA